MPEVKDRRIIISTKCPVCDVEISKSCNIQRIAIAQASGKDMLEEITKQTEQIVKDDLAKHIIKFHTTTTIEDRTHKYWRTECQK